MLLRALSLVAVVLHILVCCRGTEDKYDIETGSRNGTCPPWYYRNGENKCLFSHKLPQIVIQYGNTSEIEIGFCMTQTNSSLVVAQCPYIPNTHNFSQYHSIYQVLPTQLDEMNDSLCSVFNRKGFLCSECKENYGLAAYRYYGLMCVECYGSAWNWVAYIILLFAPPTIPFVVFLIVNINVHSGALMGFIFFTHAATTTTFFYPSIVTLIQSLFEYWPLQILLALCGIWSLDFMQFMVPPFCVSTTLTTLQLTSLGYVSSVYSFLLCVATYYLIELHARGNWLLVKIWWPFGRLFIKCTNHSNFQSSVIHAMAAFILLSYGKNLFALFQGFMPVELDTITNTLKTLSPYSVDLGSPYFGTTHAPYACLGLLECIITVILPPVLVIIYPTCVFPKLTRCFGLRRWHALRTFLELFVGSFKDGTNAAEGKRDYRFVAALYLIGRIVTSPRILWARRGANSSVVQYYAWLITAAPYIVVAVGFAFFKPHRKWYHNLVNVLLFLLTAKMCFCFTSSMKQVAISDYTLRVMVLIVLIDFTIPQIILVISFCFKLGSRWYLQRLKHLSMNCRKNRSENEEENLLQFQESPSESQPLLLYSK